MKYCPYCGAELLKEEAAFCSECGQKITGAQAEKKTKRASPQAKKAKKKDKKKTRNTTPETESVPVEDGYDGYYEDVLPPDKDRVKEGLDKELVKKIVALGAVVLLIIALCVAMMYVL